MRDTIPLKGMSSGRKPQQMFILLRLYAAIQIMKKQAGNVAVCCFTVSAGISSASFCLSFGYDNWLLCFDALLCNDTLKHGFSVRQVIHDFQHHIF